MATNPNRRNLLIAALIIIVIIILLLTRCLGKPNTPLAKGPAPTPAAPTGTTAPPKPAAAPTPVPETPEVLTPATLTPPAQVVAGAAFTTTWDGPDNRGDYISIVRLDAPDSAVGNYQETKLGKSLELTAPIEPGKHEVRYITGRSHTILGRAPIEVTPATVTITGPDEVTLGTKFSVTWVGPNNKGDFVTIVAKEALDAHYGSYSDAEKSSPQTLTAPTVPGDCELRYVTRQGNKVLARRPIKVLAAQVTLSAPDEVPAGSTVTVTWTGPNNAGDYITVVPKEMPDGRYGNHTVTEKGSPLSLLIPVTPGEAELRYMTGQGGRVIGRRSIKIIAVEVTLTAPAEAIAGTTLAVSWTGPNNAGDYITVVPKEMPDGQYGNYTVTSNGSPLNVLMPIMAGDAELRYMTGQGGRVLARRPIKITAATITLSAPPECKVSTEAAITWTGPNNPGDYITIVTKSTPDGQYGDYTATTAGSPLSVKAPKEPGDAEIRYMSGQGSKVLARIPIKIVP